MESGGCLAPEPMSESEKRRIMERRSFFEERSRKIEEKLEKKKPARRCSSPLSEKNKPIVEKRKLDNNKLKVLAVKKAKVINDDEGSLGCK